MRDMTEDEFGVFVFREEHPRHPVHRQGVFPNIGDALHTATQYAESHPKHIVFVAHRIVIRGLWEIPHQFGDSKSV